MATNFDGTYYAVRINMTTYIYKNNALVFTTQNGNSSYRNRDNDGEYDMEFTPDGNTLVESVGRWSSSNDLDYHDRITDTNWMDLTGDSTNSNSYNLFDISSDGLTIVFQ